LEEGKEGAQANSGSGGTKLILVAKAYGKVISEVVEGKRPKKRK